MDEETNTVYYRLSQIEKSLEDLKDLIISVKMNEKDLHDLHLRLDKLDNRLSSTEEDVTQLKILPQKNNSEKWEKVMNYIFRFVVTSVISVVAIKIGLSK